MQKINNFIVNSQLNRMDSYSPAGVNKYAATLAQSVSSKLSDPSVGGGRNQSATIKQSGLGLLCFPNLS